MKNSLLIATLVAIAALANVQAQQHPAASLAAGQGVVVVDIGYIFKNNIRFKQMMEVMKRDVEAAEANINKERETLQAMIEKLKNLKPGSLDFKKLEEDITQRQADLQVRVQLQKKEFMERESKNYYTVYREISDEVKMYAEANRIALVMRFNGDPVDMNNRNSILNEINKPIVYQRGNDITPIILDTLNRRAVASNPKAGGGPGSVTPQKR